MTSGVLPVSWDVAAIIFTALLYGFFVVRRCYRVLRYPRSNVLASSRESEDVSTSRTKLARSAEKDAENDPNKDRKFGEWTPVQFTYPAITPVAQQLQNMPPRPYRPFKAGEYHVTMGIRNMVWDDWIELDNQFEKFHRVRSARIRERGEQLVRVLPDDRPALVRGGAEAAAELAQELAEFLVRRYPDVYRVERETGAGDGWDGLGRVTKVTVIPVGETYDLEREDPMRVAALLVQDDLAIMIEGADGNYYLQAGAIVIPGSWRISDKIGMPLDEIHFTGEVPSYKEKLQPSLTRFFRRMTPTRPVVRENWLIQVLDPARLARADADPDELAWSTTMLGAEDTFAHPPSSYALSQSGTSQASSIGAPLPTPPPTPPRALPRATPATLRLRTERQSLRRLPRTGAVVFTVRTYSTPLADLGAEPGVPGRLASAMRGMSAESARRRRQDAFEGPLLAFLDECHRGQVERGEVPAEEA